MYGYLWRMLPGPLAVRVLTATALVLLVIGALFMWIFPWFESILGIGDVTVSQGRTEVHGNALTHSWV